MAYATLEDVAIRLTHPLEEEKVAATEVYLEDISEDIDEALLKANKAIDSVSLAKKKRLAASKAAKFYPYMGRDTSISYETLNSGSATESNSFRAVDIEFFEKLNANDLRFLGITEKITTIKYSMKY